MADDSFEGEVWVDVPETLSTARSDQVSNMGRIKRLNTGKISEGIILGPDIQGAGQRMIRLGCGRKMQIHRIVIISFGVLPPTASHVCVGHLDLHGLNSNLTNLVWITNAEAHTKKREKARQQIEPAILVGEEWKKLHRTNKRGRICDISSMGRFRTKTGRTYTPHPEGDGYSRINFDDETHGVHNLVAEYFLAPTHRW